MKILIADDDTTSRLVLGATLAKLGHAVTSVENGRQALEAWRQEQHTLVISDWMMPELDGLELCRLIRTEPALEYTYILLLTSMAGRGRYLDGMRAGADDFISKPYDEESLAARLHVAERILALHQTLRMAATHDRLTGLWNRAAIIDHLEQSLSHPADQRAALGIILADLDHFKSVNDGHGHAAGDGVLQEVARRMQARLGPGERLGRYGGEEFLVIVPDAGGGRVQALAESLREAVGARPMPLVAGGLAVTLSLGVVLSQPDRQEDLDMLVASADEALYRAKRKGRDRIEMARDTDRDLRHRPVPQPPGS